jgi:hypothetical protein
LDDLAATLRPLPAQMARNTEAIERLADDMRSVRIDLAAIRSDLAALHRQLGQIGWAMSTALVGVVIALVIAVT